MSPHIFLFRLRNILVLHEAVPQHFTTKLRSCMHGIRRSTYPSPYSYFGRVDVIVCIDQVLCKISLINRLVLPKFLVCLSHELPAWKREVNCAIVCNSYFIFACCDLVELCACHQQYAVSYASFVLNLTEYNFVWKQTWKQIALNILGALVNALRNCCRFLLQTVYPYHY